MENGEFDREEIKAMIEKYREQNEKVAKITSALQKLKQEQDELKTQIKTFMKKNALNNIYTKDGCKVVYQTQYVSAPINRKFFEKSICEKMGEQNGKEFINNIYSKREKVKRDQVVFRGGKSGSVHI